jgi:SAM-dependent methyltransferase
LLRKKLGREQRSPERLRAHYAIEKALADRLRAANKEERKRLYAEVYDELFREVPDHPQHTEREDPAQRAAGAARRARLLSRFLTPASTFLEVGPGDLALALQVARQVGKVYAVDVSSEITKGNKLPANFELILSDGSSIPVQANSVDVAYSDQLMEHLHPDDALDQLKNIFQSLKPGGVYICITPNRISGPHDISLYFSDVPSGFHLKEYTTTDLVRILKDAGFSKVAVPVPVRGRYIILPAFLATTLEAVLGLLPRKAARWLASLIVIRPILNRVIATK